MAELEGRRRPPPFGTRRPPRTGEAAGAAIFPPEAVPGGAVGGRRRRDPGSGPWRWRGAGRVAGPGRGGRSRTAASPGSAGCPGLDRWPGSGRASFVPRPAPVWRCRRSPRAAGASALGGGGEACPRRSAAGRPSLCAEERGWGGRAAGAGGTGLSPVAAGRCRAAPGPGEAAGLRGRRRARSAGGLGSAARTSSHRTDAALPRGPAVAGPLLAASAKLFSLSVSVCAEA